MALEIWQSCTVCDLVYDTLLWLSMLCLCIIRFGLNCIYPGISLYPGTCDKVALNLDPQSIDSHNRTAAETLFTREKEQILTHNSSCPCRSTLLWGEHTIYMFGRLQDYSIPRGERWLLWLQRRLRWTRLVLPLCLLRHLLVAHRIIAGSIWDPQPDICTQNMSSG